MYILSLAVENQTNDTNWKRMYKTLLRVGEKKISPIASNDLNNRYSF